MFNDFVFSWLLLKSEHVKHNFKYRYYEGYMIKMKVHYLQNVITFNEIYIIWP